MFLQFIYLSSLYTFTIGSDYNFDNLTTILGSDENTSVVKNVSDSLMVGDDPRMYQNRRRPGYGFTFPDDERFSKTRGKPPDERRYPPDHHIFGMEDEEAPMYSLMDMMEDAKNMDEFMTKFTNNPKSIKGAGFIIERFGGSEENYPEYSKCMPIPTTVCLKAPNPVKGINYIPPCTRIPRCEGCEIDGKICEPTKVEIESYTLKATRYNSKHNVLELDESENQIVEVEKHTECKLRCKVRRTDCPESHYYREKSCKCVCKNHEDRRHCKSQGPQWRWDPNYCVCEYV